MRSLESIDAELDELKGTDAGLERARAEVRALSLVAADEALGAFEMSLADVKVVDTAGLFDDVPAANASMLVPLDAMLAELEGEAQADTAPDSSVSELAALLEDDDDAFALEFLED